MSTLDEAFLASVYTESNILMLALDPDGRIVRFNAACERATGYVFEELQGKTAWDVLLLPDEAELVKNRSADVRATDFPQDGENHWVAKDGSRLLTSWSNSAVIDEDGGVEFIVCTGLDISDRMRNEKAIEEARRDAERSRGFLDAVLENVPAAVFVKEATDLTHVLSSKLHRELVNREASEIIGKDDYSIVPSSRAREYQELDRKAIAEGRIVEGEEIVDHPTRGRRVVHSRKVPVVDERGEAQLLLGISVDITERKQAEAALAAKAEELAISKQELARSEERFRTLVQNSSDVVVVATSDGAMTYQTPSMLSVLGYEPDSLLDTPFVALVHSEDADAVRGLFRACSRQEIPTETLDVRLRHHDDRWRHVEIVASNLLDDPTVGGIVLTIRDVTERLELQNQLAHQAFHDDLTGLANRALFVDRVGHVFSRRRGYDQIAILYLDFDDFKTINDSLGHSAGDELLIEFAARLRANLRANDTCARLGGDEFAILLEDVPDAHYAERVAQRIHGLFEEPFSVAGTELAARASIGIAMPTGDIKHAEELLRNADMAMYRAKRSGSGTHETFAPSMHIEAVARLELKRELERALERSEFVLHYQPIVSLSDDSVGAVEALLRWEHPRFGLLHPAEFISLTEETGLIVPLGRWALDQACRQLRAWQRQHPQLNLCANVNISVCQLREPDLISEVAQILARHGIAPLTVTLEITESALAQDTMETIARLHELKEVGVKLAIDDFGTGYSSLSYVRSFPIDVLKIPKPFIDDIVGSPNDASIAAAILNLAGTLRLDTVAEGVETAEQLERLRGLGCARAQGFHFAEALPPNRLDAILAGGIVPADSAALARSAPAANGERRAA